MNQGRFGKIRVKAVLTVVGVVVFLAIGAMVAREVRRGIISSRALKDGRAALAAKQWTQACKDLRTYLGYHSDDADVLRQYAEANLRVEPVDVQHVQAAIGGWRALFRVRPEDAKVYSELARLYKHVARQYGHADSLGDLAYIARERLKRAPQDLDAPVWLGEALIGLRQDKEAREALTTYVRRVEGIAKKPSGYVVACMLLAEVDLREPSAQNKASAMEWLDRAIRHDPNSAEAYLNRARFLRSAIASGEDLAAIAQRRLEKAPDDLTGAIWSAKALIADGKLDVADGKLKPLVDELAKRSDKAAEYVDVCLLLATTAKDGGSAAKAWLDKALTKDPDCAEAKAQAFRLARGMAVARRDAAAALLPDARRDVERAERLNPSDPVVWLVLSGEWLALGDPDRSAKALQQAAAAAGKCDPAVMREHFVDMRDWELARFGQAATLTLARLEAGGPKDHGARAGEGVALAEEALGKFTEIRHRVGVLPYAIRFHAESARGETGFAPSTGPASKPAKAGQAHLAAADKYLKELLEATKGGSPSPARDAQTAYLKAIVAKAKGEAYGVIAALEPSATRGLLNMRSRLMLSEAFIQAGQARRAAAVLAGAQAAGTASYGELRAQAFVRMMTGDWAGAREAAKMAEFLNPEDLEIRLAWIESSMRLADEQQPADRAQVVASLTKELAELRAGHPKDARVRLLQSMLVLLQDPKDEAGNARKELRSAIAECEDKLVATVRLAQLVSSLKPSADDLAFCRKACDENPGEADLWRALEAALGAAGKPDEARKAVADGAARVTDPEGRRGLLVLQALREIQGGQREPGLGRLRELARSNPQDIRTRLLLLGLPEVRSNQAESQKLVDELRAAQGPEGLNWRLAQVRLWFPEKFTTKRAEIIDLLNRCLAGDPGWAEPALILSAIHERLGDRSAAEAVCRRAFAANPRSEALVDRLMAILSRDGRAGEAGEVLKGFVGDPRGRTLRQFGLAVARGDLDLATAEHDALIASSSGADDPSSLIRLARLVYLKKKDVPAALDHLRRAQEAIQKTGRGKAGLIALADVRSWIQIEERQYSQAIAGLDELVKADGGFDAQRLRAACLNAIGERHEQEARRLQAAGKAGDAEAAHRESLRCLAETEKAYQGLAALPEAGSAGLLLLTRYCESKGKVEDAIRSLEGAPEKIRQEQGVQLRLAELLLRRGQDGDRDRSLTILQDLDRRFPDGADTLYLKGSALVGKPWQASTREAEKVLKRLLDLWPAEVRAHRLLVGLALDRGGYAEARDLAIRAQKIAAKDPGLILAQAQAERALGNASAVPVLARSVLAGQALGTADLLALTQVVAGVDDRSLAESVLAKTSDALRDHGEAEAIRLARTGLLVSLGRAAEAQTELEAFTSTEAGRQSAGAYVNLSRLCRADKKLDAADTFAAKAAAVAPRRNDVMIESLLVLEAQGKYAEIAPRMAAYSRAGKPAPEVLLVAGRILQEHGKEHWPAAESLYAQAATVAPEYPLPQIRLGQLAHAAGDLDRAEKHYRKVMALAPNSAQALNDLAWALQERGKGRDMEEALELATHATKADPRNPHIRDTRSAILEKRVAQATDDQSKVARLREARDELRECVKLSVDEPQWRAKRLKRLADVCRTLGDLGDAKEANLKEAKEMLQEALRIDQAKAVFTPKERTEMQSRIDGIAKAK
jgi:tetratricopeptide (TPR) repeat protein